MVARSLHSLKVSPSYSCLLNINSEGSQIVTLSQSLFEDNTAYVGAALRALGTTNFDTATSTFKDNTAEIGGVLATNPTQLRLVIYEVDEYFLFLETIDAAYMLTHSGTVKFLSIFLTKNP